MALFKWKNGLELEGQKAPDDKDELIYEKEATATGRAEGRIGQHQTKGCQNVEVYLVCLPHRAGIQCERSLKNSGPRAQHGGNGGERSK